MSKSMITITLTVKERGNFNWEMSAPNIGSRIEQQIVYEILKDALMRTSGEFGQLLESLLKGKRLIEVISVDRAKNSAYLAIHSDKFPNEDPLDDCTNWEIKLDKLQKLLGFELKDGADLFTDVLVDSESFFKTNFT